MCAKSAPGCITVSHATAEMLGADYETLCRGEHAVKGKVTLTPLNLHPHPHRSLSPNLHPNLTLTLT